MVNANALQDGLTRYLFCFHVFHDRHILHIVGTAIRRVINSYYRTTPQFHGRKTKLISFAKDLITNKDGSVSVLLKNYCPNVWRLL